MQDSPRHSALLALLTWYRDMGVADAVAAEATNWLTRGDVAPGKRAPARDAAAVLVPPSSGPARAPAVTALVTGAVTGRLDAPRRFPTTTPADAERRARSLAGTAASLADLEAHLHHFDGCALKATAKTLCFYRGAAAAPVMVVGEAPGREEDLAGRPFVGPAGQLLDKMLAAIGLDERHVHITNVVYWRPPGNRTPTPQEVQLCWPFLQRQIALVAPRVLVLLGGAAAKHVLGVAEGILRVRGTWREIEIAGHVIRAIATLHPAYLLRTPAHKRLAWRDLLTIKAALEKGLVEGMLPH
jgi:uracil-DNA glycosylase family 4